MPTYGFAVDWNNDGDFTDAREDVSARVLNRESVTISYGRDQDRSLSPVAAGTASFLLDNRSRDYSPENSSSPLAGNILPARPVRIQATHNGTTYTLFRGHLDGYDLEPGLAERAVGVTCLDGLAKLRDAEISTSLHEGLTTGEAIGKILDAISWPAPDRDLDTGATQIPWWWEDRTDAWTALERVVASEGPPAMVYIDGDGKFVFRDRHHRYIRTRSTTSQVTFRDLGGVEFSGLTYDHGWRDIVNSVTISVDERRPQESQEVWTSDETIWIGATDSKTITIETTDPFRSAVTPESGTDFTVESGSITSVTLSRTSGQSTTVTLTAGGSGARVDELKLRAQPLTVLRTRQVSASDSTSITAYGQRSQSVDAPWCGRRDALAVANLIVRDRKQPLPIVKLTFAGGTSERIEQQFIRYLGDRVTVVDSESGLSDDFYIERITHTITQAGLSLETEFGMEKVPAGIAVDPFILGTSTLNGTATLVD